MGLFEHFPYTNFHELNLDWITKFVKSVRDRLDLIDAAVKAAQDARDKSEEFSLESEAWAVGTKNGEAVPADAPQHENNSKYWAQQAANSASDADGFADDAKGYAEDAAASAADTTQADAAKAWAEVAEAWAVGTKDGVPVDNTAAQYENNSKYWADAAADSATTAASEAGTAAAAAVADAELYGVTNVTRLIAQDVAVKAARDITNSGNVVISLNIPGLIALTFPFADGNGSELFTIDDVGFANKDATIINARATGHNVSSPVFRTNKYLVQELYTGISAFTMVDGKPYNIHFFTVYDYTTNNWAADGVTIDVELFACKTYYKTAATALNGGTIGN